MGPAERDSPQPERFWAHIVLVLASSVLLFLSWGMSLPLVPVSVSHFTWGDEVMVGLVTLVYTGSSIVAGVLTGLLLPRANVWVVMGCCSAFAAIGLASAGLTTAAGPFTVERAVVGFATGAFYVAAASLVIGISPISRRAELIGYFSVTLWVGVAFGPGLGELMLDRLGERGAWMVAGLFPGLGALAAILVGQLAKGGPVSEDDPGRSAASSGEERFDFARDLGFWPALALALGVVGYASFQVFLPVYALSIGLETVGTVFLVQAAAILIVRIAGARYLDRMQPAAYGLVACVVNVVALACLALYDGALGVYLSGVGLGIGIAVLFPVLLKFAVNQVESRREGLVVGVFNAAYNVGSGVGAFLFGAIVSLTSFGTAFLLAAMCAAMGGFVQFFRCAEATGDGRR